MRARLLGAALAALAAPASGLAQQASAGGVACASPALLQCSILAPGFKRWFFAPFGIAPSDAEMAAQICPGSKGLGVGSTRRRPVGDGPLAQTVVVEVSCTSGPAAIRPAVGPTRASPALERRPLAGSPQDATPQLERGGGGAAEDRRRRSRAERRARREEARERFREAEAEIEAVEPRERRRPQATDRQERRATAPDTPVPVPPRIERPPEAPRAAPSASIMRPAAPETAPAAAAEAPKPLAEATKPLAEPKPSAEPKPAARPATPSKPRRTPKDDPSISYEHF